MSEPFSPLSAVHVAEVDAMKTAWADEREASGEEADDGLIASGEVSRSAEETQVPPHQNLPEHNHTASIGLPCHLHKKTQPSCKFCKRFWNSAVPSRLPRSP